MGTLIYKISEITTEFCKKNEFDLIITSAGSDFRAYEFLRKACADNDVLENVLIYKFREREESLKKEEREHYDSYKDLKCNISEINTSIYDPTEKIDELNKHLDQLDSTSNIGIDISCFTKPYFFYLIKYLKKKLKIDKLRVFYTEPRSYYFTDGLFKSYHSSSGPIQVQEIPGYTGSSVRKLDTLLVILLGFDGDLSREIDEEIAPNEIVVVNGFPSYKQKFKDVSLISNEKLILSNKDNVAYSRASNPFQVYNLLNELKEKNKDETHINIAPLGTKPMALGACLFALHNDDVRIVYPMPEIFNNSTTKEASNSWSYELPLLKF